MYQSSTFKTVINKNDKSSRFKDFRRFGGLSLHYESTELAESLENAVLLPDKRLDYFLNSVETRSQCTKQDKVESDQLFT